MTSGTYLLSGLFLFALSCGKKDSPETRTIKDRIDILYNRGLMLYDFKPDSALKIGRQVLQLARDVGDSARVVKGFTNIGYVHYIVGDYPQALDTFQQALVIDDLLKAQHSKASHYNHIGNIYKSLENFDTALQRYDTSYKLALEGRKRESLKKDQKIELLKFYDTVLCNASMNLGYVYEKKAGENKKNKKIFSKLIDSASYYENIALRLSFKLPHRKNRNVIVNNLGKIQRQKDNRDSAIFYFNQAIVLSDSVNDVRGRGESHIFKAELYDRAGMYDSAIANARLGLQEATASFYKRGILMASSVLAHAFDTTGTVDSALHYFKMKSEQYMTLFNTNKVQQVQFSAIDHRDREIARLKKQKEDFDRLLRGGGIMLILLVLLVAGTILRFKYKKKIKNRTIEKTAVIWTFLVFEFGNLLIHPFIEHEIERVEIAWLLYVKVVVLFIFSAIIARFLMNPLHHLLERWIKAKFSAGNVNEGSGH